MGGCSFVKTVLSSGCGLSLWMSDLRNPYLTHCGKEDHANGRPLDTMMRIVLNASLSIHSIVKIVVLGCGISLWSRVYAVYNPVSVENCTTMILVVCAMWSSGSRKPFGFWSDKSRIMSGASDVKKAMMMFKGILCPMSAGALEVEKISNVGQIHL